jgi:signal transduction histidine kinase/CheY-like chemotaxis protein
MGLVVFVNTILVLTPITSIVLLRRDWVRTGGAVYLTGVWLTYTLIILFNGGIHHGGLAVYIALPVSAAWLFGYQTALWTAAASFGSVTVMAILETIGIGSLPVFQGRPVGIWFVLLECTVMGVVPVSLVLFSLKEALMQSQLAQAALKRAQEEDLSRQKLESVGLLASGIAHDFNNLLGGILAEAELIEEETKGSPAVEEVNKITLLATRASERVRELMVYAGQETTDLAPVDLSRLVEEMLELLKVSIPKRLVLTTDLETNIPKIRGQAAQLRQVVMNLILNATEAMGEKGGVITIKTSLVSEDIGRAQGHAWELPHAKYARLEVTDTGSGITEEQRSRIFDPFFTTKFAGRGLGLAVVQGVVRSHGGAINLRSAPGQGTTFQILLPCAAELEERNENAQFPATMEHMPGATVKIMVVEDEEMLRLALAKMLQKRGFTVIEAHDGSSAINVLRDIRNEVDLILLDLTMPGTASLEVAEEVQRIRPETKIVITSDYGREAGSPLFQVPQVVGYIRKPFPADEVVRLLCEASLSSPWNPLARNRAATR